MSATAAITAVPSALPLTQAQLGVLLGQQLADDDSVFYAAERTDLQGAFDIVVFAHALRATLREAAALHLRLVEHDGEMMQELLLPSDSGLDAALEICEAQGWSPEQLDADIAAQLVRPFDPTRGYLFQHRLYRLAADHHVWLHRAHHLLLDGYGFQLIARRVSARYAAWISDTAAPGASFGDLAAVTASDQAYQRSPAREADRLFWLETLHGLQPVSLCANTAPGIGRGRRHNGEIPAAIVNALRSRAIELELSWPELLIAAFAGYLALHGHGQDVVLGMPVMQRLGGPVARTPCTAMNVMPLPLPRIAEQSLTALANALRLSMQRLRPHQRYRFEHLEGDLEEAGYPRGLLGTEINVMPFEPPAHFGKAHARTRVLAAGPVEDLAAIFMQRGEAIDFDLDGRPQNYSEAELQRHWQGIVDFLALVLERPWTLFKDLGIQ